MSESRIRITCENYNIEVEGSDDLIYRVFTDMRIHGLSAVKLNDADVKVRTIETPDSDASSDKPDNITYIHEKKPLPDLNILILEKRSFTQSQWMLLMAWFASHNGQSTFCKKDIKKIYSSLRRYTRMKNGDFSSFFIHLIYNNYVTQTESDCFALTGPGYDRAVELLSDEDLEQTQKKIDNIG